MRFDHGLTLFMVNLVVLRLRGDEIEEDVQLLTLAIEIVVLRRFPKGRHRRESREGKVCPVG